MDGRILRISTIIRQPDFNLPQRRPGASDYRKKLEPNHRVAFARAGLDVVSSCLPVPTARKFDRAGKPSGRRDDAHFAAPTRQTKTHRTRSLSVPGKATQRS